MQCARDKRYFSCVTHRMPRHTKPRAARFFQARMFSFKNTADRPAPNTGTRKLNTVTVLTRLNLSNRLHKENATADSAAR